MRNKKIIFYQWQNPKIIIYIILVVIIITILSNFNIGKNEIKYYFLLLFPAILIGKILYMLIIRESIIVNDNKVQIKKKLLHVSILRKDLFFTNISSINYTKVDDGIRLRFKAIYTENIWLKRYYAININYFHENKIITMYLFNGPFDSKIEEFVLQMSNSLHR
jgi:hypothetical protein